jgi:hypothetical protein
LGAVTSKGSLTVSGAEPVRYTGNITLVSETGNITVSLSGLLFGPSHLGETIDLTYKITDATGAFKGDTGSGHAFFKATSFNPSDGFVLTFGNATTAPA